MISGNKPSKKVLVSESMMGLVAAVGAADEGEGERLNVGWRFGHLPMRQS